VTAAALPQRIRASNRGITRQSCNARTPVTVAAWTPNINKRNTDRRVRVAPFHSQVKIDDRTELSHAMINQWCFEVRAAALVGQNHADFLAESRALNCTQSMVSALTQS
jgi:hypothetical protein